jgi:hypothetical protein
MTLLGRMVSPAVAAAEVAINDLLENPELFSFLFSLFIIQY